jgi:hypothetical protein
VSSLHDQRATGGIQQLVTRTLPRFFTIRTADVSIAVSSFGT